MEAGRWTRKGTIQNKKKVKSSYGNNMVYSNIQNIETICYNLSFKLENEIKPK